MFVFLPARPQETAAFFFRVLVAGLALLGNMIAASAAEEWEEALKKLPFKEGKFEFQKFKGPTALLRAFKGGEQLRGLIFLPGATDYIYFHQGTAFELPRVSRHVLGAITELTNRTSLQATFEAGFLFIHMPEEPLLARMQVRSAGAVEKLKAKAAPKDLLLLDQPWERFLGEALKATEVKVSPPAGDPKSFHFYRCYFRAHDLSSWELLKVLSLTMKAECIVEDEGVEFREIPHAAP